MARHKYGRDGTVKVLARAMMRGARGNLTGANSGASRFNCGIREISAAG